MGDGERERTRRQKERDNIKSHKSKVKEYEKDMRKGGTVKRRI